MKEEKKDNEQKELDKVIQEFGGAAEDSDEEEAKQNQIEFEKDFSPNKRSEYSQNSETVYHENPKRNSIIMDQLQAVDTIFIGITPK